MAKKKAAAHHGGAWKVAYADFVTAMMALFMVLWICAQDKKILLSTSRYFQSPFKSPLTANSGVMPYEKSSQQSGSNKSEDQSSSGSNQPSNKDNEIELSFLNSVAASFYRLLHLDQDLDQKPIDIQVTSDGLRMTLYDRAKHPLFADNGSTFTPWGKFILQNLAWLIDRHHFRVTIDGHTKSNLSFAKDDYSSWELSTDRANAARRILVYYAVDPGLIERVTGYGDTRPLAGEAPDSQANQRITLSLTLRAALSEDKTPPVPPPSAIPAAPAPGVAPAASISIPGTSPVAATTAYSPPQ